MGRLKRNLATQLSKRCHFSLFSTEGMGISAGQKEELLRAGAKTKARHKSVQLKTLIVVKLALRSELIESGF